MSAKSVSEEQVGAQLAAQATALVQLARTVRARRMAPSVTPVGSAHSSLHCMAAAQSGVTPVVTPVATTGASSSATPVSACENDAKSPCEAALCEICGAFEVIACCEQSHWICRPCSVAYQRGYEKLCMTGRLTCPVIECLFPFVLGSTEVKPAPRLARMEKVPPSDPAYGMVVELFGKTLDRKWITDIFRVSNPPMQILFEACRSRMQKEGRLIGTGKTQKDVGANERLLFHATPRAAAGGIVREGFDASRAGSAFGTALGPGIYVSPFASFSHGYSKTDSSDKRCMLLCRVLLGDDTGRDSKSDGATKPNQYVVRREQQILPHYIIYYQVSS